MKQIAENVFRQSCNDNVNIKYIIKLQVNHLAHQVTPADYFVQTKDKDIFIEIKQTSPNKKGECIFNLDRVTQETRLLIFNEILERNKSYIFFYFKFKESRAFLIDINSWLNFKRNWLKSTMKIEDFEEYFYKFECFKTTKNSFNIIFN